MAEVRGAPAPSLEASDVVDAEVVETKDSHGSDQRQVPAEPTTRQAKTSAELLEQITGTAVDIPALHDLRHQDAPRRLLLRLRGLRQHQRLQLSDLACTRPGSTIAGSGPACFAAAALW